MCNTRTKYFLGQFQGKSKTRLLCDGC